jgi:hypothetical protein
VCAEEKGVKKGKSDSNVSDHLHADQDRELSGNSSAQSLPVFGIKCERHDWLNEYTMPTPY